MPIVECILAPYAGVTGIAGNDADGNRRCASHVPLQILFALMAGVGVVIISRPTFLFDDDAGSGDVEIAAASSSSSSSHAAVAHYGTKPGHFETSKIHFPTSEGVSEVSERANE